MYGCESWTIKKAEPRRIDAFELWCWKRLLSPLDCKEIKQVNPKEVSPKYSLEELMLKWKLQYFGHLIRRTDLLEKNLIGSFLLGKIEAGKDWGQEEKGMTEDEMLWWHHRLYGHEFEQTLGVDDGQGRLACCNPWGHKESDMTEQLNWTDKVNCGRNEEI